MLISLHQNKIETAIYIRRPLQASWVSELSANPLTLSIVPLINCRSESTKIYTQMNTSKHICRTYHTSAPPICRTCHTSAHQSGFVSHIYTHTHTHTHMHTYTYIYTHVHTYATHTHVFTHIHTFTHIYTNIHTYSHIYTHIKAIKAHLNLQGGQLVY